MVKIIKPLSSLFLILTTFFIIHPSVLAAVVINEIFPKTQDPSYEWIELYNNGNDSVSLDRWNIQNTAGTTFGMNASTRINGHGFLLLTQPQTGISLNSSGDTVKLTNEKGEVQDTQSFYGILGFNTSIGRSIDGGGVWINCTTATPEKPNDCPAPSPTVTPVPSPTPQNTPTLTITPSLEVVPTDIPAIVQPTILPSVSIATSTPVPTPTTVIVKTLFSSNKNILGIGMVIGAVWLLLLAMILIKKKKNENV